VILILGGTGEARELAVALDARGIPVTSSLAGRVARPRLPVGDVRVGGFGGPDALARWLAEHRVAAVVDAEKIEPTEDEIRTALEPFDRAGSGDGPYQIQHELQETMQDLVGIVRREEEMQRALQVVTDLKTRSAHIGVTGNREYNPGWHTALDLKNLLTVSEAITRAALDYVLARFEVTPARGERDRLADAWLELDPYPDVRPALTRLRTRGVPPAVLTNGVAASAERALRAGDLRDVINDVLSVETARGVV